MRLTPGHGSRRLNSVNPLDPFDCGDLEGRLARAGRRFATAGRPLTLRQTPLTPPSLVAYLDGAGWSRFAETIVMTGEIPPHEAGETVEHLPLRDLARFAEARLAISGEPPESASTLLSILEAIKPECGLFLFEERGFGPTAVAMAVHDSDLLGINQVAVHAQRRRAGLGTALLSACLRWGRLKGARQAWLAVEAANAPARALYERLRLPRNLSLCLPPAEGPLMSPPREFRILVVAACALIDGDGRVLIAQRPEGKPMAGLWEFPAARSRPAKRRNRR